MLSKKYYTILTTCCILAISYVGYRLIDKWIQFLSEKYQGWSVFDIVSLIGAAVFGITGLIVARHFYLKEKKKMNKPQTDKQDKV